MKSPLQGGEPRRADRVAERLRAELAELMLRGRLRDPGAKDVVLSSVRMSDDLQHARIYVRTLGEANEKKRERVIAALTRAVGFLRKELAPKLALRRVPELEFFWDDVVDQAQRIESLLSDIKEGE